MNLKTYDELCSLFISRRKESRISGNIIPADSTLVDLGASDAKFNALYVTSLHADAITAALGVSVDLVDNLHASSTPTPNYLLALDGSAHFPTSVYPAALLADGSRPLTGNLAMDTGITIDGLDPSVHLADQNAHHNRQHFMTGTDHLIPFLTVGQVLAADGSSAFSWRFLDHRELASLLDDDHTQYVHIDTDRIITAQHTFSPVATQPPFLVSGGAAGQLVAGLLADAVNKTLTDGNGTTKNGDLKATGDSSISIDINNGDGLTIDVSNNLIIDYDSTIPVIVEAKVGGEETGAIGSSVHPARIDHKHPITTAAPLANSVYLGASTKGVATTLARSDHYHNLDQTITPTWSGLHIFNAGARIASGQTLQFGADVALQRGGADILALATGDSLQSAGYSSGISGWSIFSDGTAEFNNAFVRGELHATTFVKDLIQAQAGTMIIAKSAASLSALASVPGSGTWQITVNDPPGGAARLLPTDGDICRIKGETLTGMADTWFTISGYVNNNNGTQSYTCTFQSGSRPVDYTAGSQVIDYGPSGQGFLQMTADLVGAPYYAVATHSGSPWTTQALKARLGNLKGSYGAAVDRYGLGIGDYISGNYLSYNGEAADSFILRAANGAIKIDASGITVNAKVYQYIPPPPPQDNTAWAFWSASFSGGKSIYFQDDNEDIIVGIAATKGNSGGSDLATSFSINASTYNNDPANILLQAISGGDTYSNAYFQIISGDTTNKIQSRIYTSSWSIDLILGQGPGGLYHPGWDQTHGNLYITYGGVVIHSGTDVSWDPPRGDLWVWGDIRSAGGLVVGNGQQTNNSYDPAVGQIICSTLAVNTTANIGTINVNGYNGKVTTRSVDNNGATNVLTTGQWDATNGVLGGYIDIFGKDYPSHYGTVEIVSNTSNANGASGEIHIMQRNAAGNLTDCIVVEKGGKVNIPNWLDTHLIHSDHAYNSSLYLGQYDGSTVWGANMFIGGRDYPSYEGKVMIVGDSRNAAAAAGEISLQQNLNGTYYPRLTVEKGGNVRIASTLKVLDGRYFLTSGAKSIGDNVATTIFTLTGTGITHFECYIRLSYVLSSNADAGYVAYSEERMITLRYYYGAGPYNLNAGVANVAGAKATSVASGFSDVLTGTVTVTVDNANHRFLVNVQSDHAGSYTGGVYCTWYAEIFMGRFGSTDPTTLFTIT